ncbi:hypothetical protein [Streptomyces longispororuber]|uniref:hypothetical protein n=1 Tax=Streptomyces longispororuber TaxID=68230 RepID=UPI0036FD2C1C
MTHQPTPPEAEQHPPQPSRILAEPATVAACASDLGTDPGAAREQLALARAHGNEAGGSR